MVSETIVGPVLAEFSNDLAVPNNLNGIPRPSYDLANLFLPPHHTFPSLTEQRGNKIHIDQF